MNKFRKSLLPAALSLSLIGNCPVIALCAPTSSTPQSTQWMSANAKPSLGISTKDVRSAQGNKGVMVEQVNDSNSPLQVNDVILSVDGRPVSNSAALNELIGQKEIGAELKVKVNRDGKDIPLTLTLIGEDPEPVSSTISSVIATDGPKVKLENATALKLVMEETISSNKAKAGDTVNYSVQDDVKGPSGEILIRKGAKAGGTVTAAKGAGSFGRKGKLEFTAEWVETVDGQRAQLRTTQQANGKSNQGVAIASILFLSILGGFIKGKNASVNKGAVIPAFINEDIVIKSATK